MTQSLINQDSTDQSGKQLLEPRLWVERHADFLYSYAFARLNDDEQCRDLVQETFLAALQKTDSFRGDSSERTWLTAILRYKVIDVYRKRSGALNAKERDGAAVYEEDFFEPDDDHWKREHRPALFGVEDKDPLHNKEFMGILQQCLQRLPPLWMSVFRLKHLDDEGTEMICEQMRISPANFWVIIHRAKVNLRSCLQKNWI